MVTKFKRNILRAGMFRPVVKQAPPGVPDFSRINPIDMRYILEIANRGRALSMAYRLTDKKDDVIEANAELIAIDVACVHMARGLNLKAFYESDDLTFMAEYAAIEKNIVRATCFFPGGVALRFASSGEKLGA